MDGVREAGFAELTPGQLYGLLRLRVEVFVVEQTCPYPELDGRDTEPSARHLWIEAPVVGEPAVGGPAAGRVVAVARVLHDGDRRRIGRVATAADARGRGLAARLVRRGLGLSAGHPVDIDAQAHLADWYARFGFAVSGPGFVEDGIPHVPMTAAPPGPPRQVSGRRSSSSPDG